MNKTILSSIVTCLLGVFTLSASAAVVTDRSVINIVQFDLVNPTYTANSTATAFAHQLDSSADIQAYGDLATGQVGTRVTGSEGSFSQSIVSVFDTLTFNTGSTTPVDVAFNLSYDGQLSSPSQFEHPRSETTVRIFDITGMTNWLETSGLFNTTGAVDAANLLTFERISFDLNDVPHNGSVNEFDTSVMGHFLAESSREYGIQISSNSFAGPNSSADFLNTGTFSFTGLNGATVTSGSGIFLSQQVTAVPVPAAIWLLGSSLIALIGVKRRVASSKI